MRRKRRTFGILFIVTALIIMQLPVPEADAATSASDFQMEGNTLIKYRGKEKDVSVPDSVEIIGESAFEDNDTVERITLPGSVKEIKPYAFWSCDNLNTVVLGSGLTEISDYSFMNCKGLEYMTIPPNIQSIGIRAFVDCVNMKEISIPPEVTTIHETSFDGCYKLYIDCEPGSPAYYYALDFYERQKEMPEYEDVSDYDPSDVVVPEEKPEEDTDATVVPQGDLLGSTHVVGNQAVVFIDNTGANVYGEDQRVEEPVIEPLGNLVSNPQPGATPKFTIVDDKIVADQAYYRDNTLKYVSLPQGIHEIGEFAFSRSTLTNIEMHPGVTDICYGAFYHCDYLKDVKLPSTIENVEPKAFAHSKWVEDFLEKGTEDFLISGNVLIAYRGSGGEVTIPEGVTVIAGEAFLNKAQIQSVICPSTLQNIGEGAFEGCISLTNVKLNEGLTQIKDRAFYDCSLKAITIPATVTEQGLRCFDKNVRITYEGNIPANVFETSAQRLSNESYRELQDESDEPGVTVTGVEAAAAKLEGANRSYTLHIQTAEDDTDMCAAYERYFAKEAPRSMVTYHLQLTDSSGIPLTKLGKQNLTVILPVPENLAGENIVVYSLDRNGQLEKHNCSRVKLDEAEAVKFQTDHLPVIAMCSDGTTYQPGETVEEYVSFQNFSRGPGFVHSSEMNVSGDAGMQVLVMIKWITSLGLLIMGSVLVLSKAKRKK